MPRLVNRSSRVSEWVSQELTVHSDCSPVTAHLPWVDSYVPESEAHLVIHHSKLRELTCILNDVFTRKIDPTERSGGPILLLTGPPGCGKTTALRVLLHSESVKTTHPVSLVEWTDEPVGGDELNHLEQFVSQLGRYGQVNLETDEWHDSSATPCALILKNLPVSIADSAVRFHNLLRQHRTHSRPWCLLVLILSSSTSSNEDIFSERLLCPASLRSELGILRVEFNPVAPSLVLKALTHILKSRGLNKIGSKVFFPRPVLQQLANECSGDLRTAINQLQFLSKIDWSDRKSAPLISIDSKGDCRRDVGLPIFRALGKILHGKRGASDEKRPCDYSQDASVPPLPSHLAHWKRPPLGFDIEHILDQCQMDGDNFVSWLHENYLDFTPHMTATQWVADRFSWTDAYLSGGMNWRLGLTAAADCHHMQSASYRGTASTGRHYPTVVMSRTLVLSYNMVEESANGGENADTHLQKGFHQFRSPWATGAWRKAMEHLSTVFDLLCRSQLSSLQVTSVCMTGRKHLLMDWLPLALEVPNWKNCIPCGSLTTLTNSCRLSTPSHSHSRPKVISSGHITGRPRPNGFSKVDCEDDGWICPMDALLEGAELPIEEDLSDDQFARGR